MNRIDEIVVFDPLGRDELREIVEIQVRLLAERLSQRKLTIELTDAAKDRLADAGYDPTFGARPLRRLIQREVQDPLAMRLLNGELAEGDHVVVDVEGDALVLRAEAPSAAV